VEKNVATGLRNKLHFLRLASSSYRELETSIANLHAGRRYDELFIAVGTSFDTLKVGVAWVKLAIYMITLSGGVKYETTRRHFPLFTFADK
jgi:hypothetical protein